jgi:hypothetical protein
MRFSGFPVRRRGGCQSNRFVLAHDLNEPTQNAGATLGDDIVRVDDIFPVRDMDVFGGGAAACEVTRKFTRAGAIAGSGIAVP